MKPRHSCFASLTTEESEIFGRMYLRLSPVSLDTSHYPGTFSCSYRITLEPHSSGSPLPWHLPALGPHSSAGRHSPAKNLLVQREGESMEGIGLERGGLCSGGAAIRDVMNELLAQIKRPWHRKQLPHSLCSGTKHHHKIFIDIFSASPGRQE